MNFSNSATQWVKFGKMKRITFIGRDYICIGNGCYLKFFNIFTKQQILYNANNKEVGEGVGPFTGHRTLSIFASADRCRFPIIRIQKIPSLTEVFKLDKGTDEDYLQLAFTENDYLISLNDSPSFAIILWNWRNGTKVHTVNTNTYGRYQSLKCNLTTPIVVAQLETGSNTINIWDVNMCGKICIMKPHTATCPSDCGVFTDALWTYEGALLVLDINGITFKVESDFSLKRVIQWETGGDVVPSFAWYKAGLVIAGPNGELKHFKKFGDWECVWSVEPPSPIAKLISDYKESLVGRTIHGDLLCYTAVEPEFKFLVQGEGAINDVCLIYPTGEYIVTFQRNREIVTWSVATGEMQHKIVLSDNPLAIKENPEYPYIGIAYEHGVLELFSLYNPKEITSMTKFNLSKNSLNSVYFTDFGKVIIAASTIFGEFFILEGVPGTKIQIIFTLTANRQICDYMLVASRTCMRLFVIYVTSDTYVAGNKITRYCIIHGKPTADVKVYDLESQAQMYTKIYATKKDNRDRVFYVVPMTTKLIHELTTKRADPVARLTGTIDTEHQMKKIIIRVDAHHAVTWAYDGLVIMRTPDFQQKEAVIMPHYRNTGGVFKALCDPHGKYIISLGRDSVLVCTSLSDVVINTNKQKELQSLLESKRFVKMFTRPTHGMAPKGELEGKTWAEIDQINKELQERQLCAEERHDILVQFSIVKRDIQELLTKNLEGPDNEKLDVQTFNVDIALKEEKIKQSQEECKKVKLYLEALIVAQDEVANWIKNFCWDPMLVQGQDVSGIFENWSVDNYALRKYDFAITVSEAKLKLIAELRNLENQMAKKDSLQPWIPKTKSELDLLLEKPPDLTKDETATNLLEALEDEEQVIEERIDADTETAFLGSTSHYYVKLHPGYYTQFEVQSFLQSDIMRHLNLVQIRKVKEYFNTIFNEMMDQKIRDMSTITEKNARLRYIVSEINHFSVDQIDICITDPPWLTSEFPESILTVEDKEIGMVPYVSPSQQEILDAKAAEQERIRLLLLADDFRERALMSMMNGVLEVKWEDILRRETPLPKCMTEKTPAEYIEEDHRAIKEYEEAVQFLNSERERYKRVIAAEYGKTANNIRDSIKKFNKRLTKCFVKKIFVEAAIKQESLKLSRQQLKNHKRILLNKEEINLVQHLKVCNEDVIILNSTIAGLLDAVHEMKVNMENFVAKDKQLERTFRREFIDTSSVVQDQCLKLYKKRPKANVRILTTVQLVLETAKALVSLEKSLLLTSECLEYIKSTDSLDLYVNVPPAVDEHNYSIVVKHRRLKIELELRMKALQMEIQEGEHTISLFQKNLQQKKELTQQLQVNLDHIRKKRLHLFHNIEVQLVLKQGLVEVPQTGSIGDFSEAIMINRKDVETINKIIIKGGQKKIKAMKNAMNLRRSILAMEWEHQRLQMKIQDLQSNYQEVNSMQVTKDIQSYLKFKSKGFPVDKGMSFEDEIDTQKASFERIIKEKRAEIMTLEENIGNFKKKNRLLDKQITTVNVDVCEYQLDRDYEMEQREKDVMKIRMKTLLKRANLIKEIQKNHSNILMLQTELELLRLKTYPTLSYTVLQ
ncbi:hypothetical protein FQA39_LY05314 [Lamprigera yunnana]|nr:hypothetical protein FQA39_LY05314 [Lamprigera yunnana]